MRCFGCHPVLVVGVDVVGVVGAAPPPCSICSSLANTSSARLFVALGPDLSVSAMVSMCLRAATFWFFLPSLPLLSNLRVYLEPALRHVEHAARVGPKIVVGGLVREL